MDSGTIESYTRLATADFAVIGGYLVLSIAIGLFFARRGTQSVESFFIGGRRMSWWLAGLALTAGAFAADTPLWLGDIIYRRGIEGMWLHWAPGIGLAFFVFTIAPMWRRAGIMTDLEFLELRYSGRAATWLRGLYSCFYGLIINVMVMAVSTLSITTVLQYTTGWSKGLSLLVTLGVAIVYCVMSGVWGVVGTGLMQFVVTLLGFWVLAIVAIVKTGGLGGLAEAAAAVDWPGRQLNVLPSFSAVGLPLMTIVFLFTFRWIEQTCAGQALAQRLFSVSSTREASKTALIFATIYYSLIPLPWIIAIVASKVHMPELTDGQQAYPRIAMALLPVGLRGLLIAAMMAAFMSTYATQLNWGASYLINDLYRRFLVRGRGVKHYVVASQLTLLPVGIASALLAYVSDSILNLLFYIILFQSGIWTVNLGRWISWRVSSRSEVAALVGSFAVGIYICLFQRQWIAPDLMEQYFGHRMLLVMIATPVIWIVATLLTKPTDPNQLDHFYRTVRPLGFWGPVARRVGLGCPYRVGPVLYGWLVNLVAIYSVLVGLIKLIFGAPLLGMVLLLVGLGAIVLAFRKAQRDPVLALEGAAADVNPTALEEGISHESRP